MPGNKIGAAKAKAKNLVNDPDFYRKIGHLGGLQTYRSGKLATYNFQKGAEKTREAGRKGGLNSSRRGVKNKTVEFAPVFTPKSRVPLLKRLFTFNRGRI